MTLTDRLRGKLPLILIWLAVSAVLIVVSLDQIVSGIGWGPDDQLRQVQLRDWLAGQSWFDTTQYRIASPDSQPMHWPRLVELPLALVILILSPVIGPASAELAAMVIVPLVALGLAMWLVAKIAEQLFDRKIALLSAALTATAVAVVAQLRPMRIDHHGWQIVLALAVLWTMFWPDKRKAGQVMGLSLALWLSISLEGLPLAVAFIALLSFRWVVSLDEGVRLFWTLAGFLVGTLVLYLVNHGQIEILVNYCDAIAPAHLMACAAGALVILPAIKFAPASWPVRLMALGVAGGSALGTFYASAPQCVGSAFGQLDPMVRDYWLVNVREGMPIWTQPWKEIVTLFGGSIVVGLGSLAYIQWRGSDGVDREKLFLLTYALLWAFIVSLLVQRAAAVAAVYALPLVGWAVQNAFVRARAITRPLTRILATVAVVFLILPGPLMLGMMNAVDGKKAGADVKKTKSSDASLACDSSESLAALNALPRSHMIAPFDFGPEILVQTPHSVLATSHHRNDGAMADQIRIFTAPPETARHIVEARGIGYILACPDEAELNLYAKKHPEGLWAMLGENEQPDWLEPVKLSGSAPSLWRVVPKQ
ncbi:hypothetical protein [Parasphingorhabdus cellanae]|uniref:AcrB/AcrD/AcrF family protein n=1 Tax=Parasphingorhabdus cellanae TaxID=2806553 RepID=A0ABX7T340_9SPHN|nr:hypothetical protein [Parasphingorhabdus cellanae]QTD54492.1 hypothetical protein J4G78_09310 [Parasphingorhabdus cellanae]